MNPMLSALKNRRSSQGEPQQDKGSGGGDLKSFLDQLSPEAKSQLAQMLNQDAGGAEQIAKGAPSKGEQAKIAERAAQENQHEQAEGEDMGPVDYDSSGVDSDKIALDMLDTRFKNAAPAKPRNLHERVQTNMAKDLKAKGKI